MCAQSQRRHTTNVAPTIAAFWFDGFSSNSSGSSKMPLQGDCKLRAKVCGGVQRIGTGGSDSSNRPEAFEKPTTLCFR